MTITVAKRRKLLNQTQLGWYDTKQQSNFKLMQISVKKHMLGYIDSRDVIAPLEPATLENMHFLVAR